MCQRSFCGGGHFKTCLGAGEMAPEVKELAAKSEDVSLIPGTQAVGGEGHLLHVVPSPPHMHHGTC